MSESPILEKRTIGGLHDFLVREIFPRYAKAGQRAVDLGAGSGALAVRLCELGLAVLAVDIDAEGFKAPVPFRRLDLNDVGFAAAILDGGGFDLVTAVEVMEHLESPINFLRNVRRLLHPEGVAIVTTPNVDNLPARVKFLLRGRLRGLDEAGERTHITPIFWDLLTRQWLPRAGLRLVEHVVFPPGGYKLTRPEYAWAFWLAARIFGGDCLLGDTHVFVLQRSD
ncbi:MAG: class I SAM-dependent methyltransferase [Armatimonadota bacterium]|nr:class I SAM-dependent methyltransferase [Armatimonadota bacterium]MDR7544787.1 class I SAM-dependent methyltransferase [Armatimonadota bacterium]